MIVSLLDRGGYDEVVYSAGASGGLGTGIFTVADEVKRYIVERLEGLRRT